MNLRITCFAVPLIALTLCMQDTLLSSVWAQGSKSEIHPKKTVTSSLPPTIEKGLAIAAERYSYDAFAEYDASTLKINQIPSQCIALGRDKDPIRISTLSKIDGKREYLVYKVEYPAQKLTSSAKVKLGWYRSIVEELFEGKWLIKYRYTKPGIEPIPVSFTVFAYSPKTGRYDSLLGKWTVKEVLQGGHLRCQDDQGGTIIRDVSDIEIGSGRM